MALAKAIVDPSSKVEFLGGIEYSQEEGVLNWASQGFGLEHCKGVVEVLRVAGPRLKSLDLSDNGLNDRFAESLAEGLASSLLQEIEYAFFCVICCSYFGF